MQHSDQDAYGAAARQMRIQQAKAAVAAEANSPEALAAEAARQKVKLEMEAAEWRASERAICDAKGEDYRPEILEPSAPLPGGVDEMVNEGGPVSPIGQAHATSERRSRLAERLQELDEDVPDDVEAVLEDPEEEPEPEPVMGGAHLVRWILVPADENDGWTLGLSTEAHTSEAPDAVYLEVTQAMMRKWRNAPTNAKDLERFAAGLMEKVADSLAEDLTDGLIEALERITTGELREKQHLVEPGEDPEAAIAREIYESLHEDLPTETSVGEDDPSNNEAYDPGEPEVEPFASLEDYVAARDSHSQTMTREEFSSFLDDNQDLEDALERRASTDA